MLSMIVHMIFYYTDRDQFWAKCIPTRIEFFKKHSKTGNMPCVTPVGLVNGHDERDRGHGRLRLINLPRPARCPVKGYSQ